MTSIRASKDERSWYRMNKKIITIILGGLIGLLLGIIIGGYIGLVVGGTFLGGFDIYEKIGIEGYVLTTYIGALIGGLFFTFLGLRFALKIVSKAQND